ncbi:hypothetical protein RB653_000073 [Dictyostelium firmibasis]|uniref:FZ domain-containing protein n=1 Tax=Dictyostelium firmibasis TaxID=79012 RepID=A0AAN7U2B1_9MYCE
MNKLISFFLVSLLLVAVTTAQTSYPNLPLEFTADVQIQVETSQSPFPMPSVSGTLYYAYQKLVQRMDSTDPMFGQTITTLDRYDQMNEYNYASGDCKCSQISGDMPLYTILPGSTFQGQVDVNGVASDQWQFSLSSSVNISLFVDPSREVLTQAVMVVSQQGTTMTSTITFSNVNTEPISADIFDVPSYCSCPTPAPPVIPPANACPGNPPSGCDCAPALSFCSEVNYPIASADDATTVDSMVEETFNNFVSFSKPTTACASNMKSFLCGTLFPLCTGTPSIMLPCANLCPSCSCGGSGNNTCASALPNTACTQYGSGFC